MKKKKSLLGLFLLAFKAKANIVFVISAVLLIVGGILIYMLWKMSKFLDNNPSSSGTNDVSQLGSYWLIGYDNSATQTYATVSGGFFPYWGEMNYTNPANYTVNSGMNIAPASGFTIQYGTDATNEPWVAQGSKIPIDRLFNCQTISSTESNYTVAISGFGSTMIYSATTNPAPSDGLTLDYTGSSLAATNAAGDYALAIQNKTNTVVVERSSDLKNWVPIFTNQVLNGNVQTYTDYTPFPDPVTFTNGGTTVGGGPAPVGGGGSGAFGTSVSSYIPGWYYRLCLTTNTP